jgi:hypothetical protein
VLDMADTTGTVRPEARARIAGLCYLGVIAGGLFTQGIVQGTLIHPDDATATARAIAEHETLWRWGLAVHLLYLLPALTVTVLLVEIVHPVHATLARLALATGLTSVAVEAGNLLQLAVLLFSYGFGLALAFFAGFCVLVGVLLMRSLLVPRILGLLMVVAGACYLLNTLALLLSPTLADRIFPEILLPCLLAELSLALWLTARGTSDHGRRGRLDTRQGEADVPAGVATGAAPGR